MPMKTCTTCLQEFPPTQDFFYASHTGKHGLTSECKTCLRKRARHHYASNATKRRAYSRSYREKNNREKRLVYAKAYNALHKDTLNIRAKERYAKHSIHALSVKKRYYASHRETLLAKQKVYRAENPDVLRAAATRHRAAKQQAAINDLTAKQWQTIKQHYGYRCVYCGAKPRILTQDHLTPLSKGGNHTFSNVVPACRSCNSRKRTGPPLSPVQPLLLL